MTRLPQHRQRVQHPKRRIDLCSRTLHYLVGIRPFTRVPFVLLPTSLLRDNVEMLDVESGIGLDNHILVEKMVNLLHHTGF